MESAFDNRINNSEIILLGDEVILKSEGIHRTVTDELKGVPADLLSAIKYLSLKQSNSTIDEDSIHKDKAVATNDEGDLKSAMSLDELLKTEFPEARWVVDQLFESGTINMISAPPNKWKSWIVILCAICVASGKALFEKFSTEKQAVMIVNEEDTERLLQERCNMLMDEPEALPIYFHIGKQIKLEDDFVDQLIKEAKEKGVRLLIFDSLRSVHKADENSSQAMQEVMDQLKRITRQGITVLLTHHNRKKFRGGRGNDSSGEESRGSSAINAGIHGHISCEEEDREDGKYFVIFQQKLKAGPKMEPFDVLIKHNKELGKFLFTHTGSYKKEEKKMNEVREAIMETFMKNEKGFSVNDFVEMDIGGMTIIRTVLKILESQKILKTSTLKEAEKEGLPTYSNAGKHNTKIYFMLIPNTDKANDEPDIFSGL